MTTTIKSENILKVINNFKKVLPLATEENHLRMDTTTVCDIGYKCGTIHCHAGWYAVERYDWRLYKKHDRVSFWHGIKLMCDDMGLFPEKTDYLSYYAGNSPLCKWVKANPELWGSECGEIFASAMAFYHPIKRQNGAENLQHIIDHWTEVYDRVVLEEKKARLLSEPPVETLINEAIKEKELV